MATVAQVPVVVPGLHVPPTIEDLEQSSLTYNDLPDDGVQPEVQEAHLQELAGLFTRYNVENKFGVHLIHGHSQLDEGDIMLGSALTLVRGCWTKPVSINEVNPSEIHGHIFKLTGNGKMQAYEYRKGPVANLDGIDPAFFQELIKYLQANDLSDLLGLQVLGKDMPEMMCELVLEGNGTVMLDERDVKDWISYRPTGFALRVPGMTKLQGSETHAKTNRDTHQVFIGGKIGKEDPLMDVLRKEDFIY